MASTHTTVLLVDDHDLIRQGLARAFERTADFVVVGQGASLGEARRIHDELAPDVVVTDVRLPDGTGLELVSEFRQRRDDVGLVVLTMYAGDDRLFEAMQAGASAFVAKDAEAAEVIAAARHASVSPRSFAASGLADAMQRKLTSTAPRLSQREEDVLNLLAEGLGVSSIARTLYVSESTAKTHISRIYEKLGAANRAQAIMMAIRSGILSTD